jgi:hypothetical protein
MHKKENDLTAFEGHGYISASGVILSPSLLEFRRESTQSILSIGTDLG